MQDRGTKRKRQTEEISGLNIDGPLSLKLFSKLILAVTLLFQNLMSLDIFLTKIHFENCATEGLSQYNSVKNLYNI